MSDEPKPALTSVPTTAAASLDRRVRMLRTAMGPVIGEALNDPDVGGDHC